MKKSLFPTLLILSASALFFSCATVDKLNEFSANMNRKIESSTSSKNQDADKWDIAKLDTARSLDYLSTVEKDVVLEMNKARSNPSLYAELYIAPRAKKFDGKLYNGSLLTSEGAAVVNECVSYMKKLQPLSVFAPEKGLSLAAQQHSSTQCETAQTGHTGVDGSTPFTRIEKYGSYRTAGENISYGSKSGRDIVVQFLVDDGVSNRGHRKNILNKDFSSTGVGYANKHKAYGSVCVITFAGGYAEK